MSAAFVTVLLFLVFFAKVAASSVCDCESICNANNGGCCLGCVGCGDMLSPGNCCNSDSCCDYTNGTCSQVNGACSSACNFAATGCCAGTTITCFMCNDCYAGCAAARAGKPKATGHLCCYDNAYDTCQALIVNASAQLSSTGSAVGDPHFTAFDGEEFDFMGEDGQIYNLYSSYSLNINARFRQARHPDRYPNYENPGFMDFIGVRYGRHRFSLSTRPSAPSINGHEHPFPKVNYLDMELADPEMVVRLSPNSIMELHAGTPGAVHFFSILISQHNDEWMEQHLNIAMNISSSEFSSGLLGQTRRVGTFSSATGVGADHFASLSSGKKHWSMLVSSQPNAFRIQGDDIYQLLDTTNSNSSIV